MAGWPIARCEGQPRSIIGVLDAETGNYIVTTYVLTVERQVLDVF